MYLTPAIDRLRLRDGLAREPILALLEAGLQAVSPEAAVDRCIQVQGTTLRIVDPASDRSVEHKLISGTKHVFVLGAGKASVRMAARLESLLGPHLAGGVVVAPAGAQIRLRHVRQIVGDHPFPTSASEAAGRELLKFAESRTRGDLVLCLFSGGGSSLIAVPQPGLEPGDLQAVSSELLRSGVPVRPMNIVRRHLSSIHGGRLAAALRPASFVTLLLSDVAGDLPETIASGPTVADPSTYMDALDVIDQYGVRGRLPGPALRVLERGRAGALPETLKPGDSVFRGNPALLAAAAGDAVSAMAAASQAVGMRPVVVSGPLGGDADALGKRLARIALRLAVRSRLLLAHGETTVVVRGSGRGGRNQQAAAAAALRLSGCGGVIVTSFASDGVDGVTPAAGAIVDGRTAQLVRENREGFTLEQAVADNDCYPALQASGDLLMTGPTGTNVADLFVAGGIRFARKP